MILDFKLKVIKMFVSAVGPDELFVGSVFYYSSCIKDKDTIAVGNGGEAMGDCENCSSEYQLIESLLNHSF